MACFFTWCGQLLHTLKKFGYFPFFYFLAIKTVKLGFLMICFIQLTCVPNLLKFKFADNYNIIDSAFNLNNIFMYRIIRTSNSRISIF